MADEKKKKKGSPLGTVGRAIGRGAKRTARAAKKAVVTDPRVKRIGEIFTTEAPDTPKRTTTPNLTKEKIEAARKKPVSRRRKVVRGALRGVGGALRTRRPTVEMVGDVVPAAGTPGTPLARASQRTIQELKTPVRRKTRTTTRRATRFGGR